MATTFHPSTRVFSFLLVAADSDSIDISVICELSEFWELQFFYIVFQSKINYGSGLELDMTKCTMLVLCSQEDKLILRSIHDQKHTI